MYLSNDMQPYVSIVCPVYHSSDTLSKCLQSIRRQTFMNWECLIILDGADCASSEIAYKYAKDDLRFIVISQVNQGRSAARNRGIKSAKGLWVTFIDSDDELLPTYLETMSLVALNYKSDIIYGNYIKESNEVISHVSNASCDMGLLDLEYARIANLNFDRICDYKSNFMFDNYNCRTCWGKYYSKHLLDEHTILFPQEIKIGEDVIFNYYCLLYAKSIAYTNRSNYVYNDLNTGTVRSFSIEDFLSIINSSSIIERLAKENVEYASDLLICLAYDFLGIFNRAATFASIFAVKKVCNAARDACTDFVQRCLIEYIDKDNSAHIIKLFHYIYIQLMLHNMWEVVFMIRRCMNSIKKSIF